MHRERVSGVSLGWEPSFPSIPDQCWHPCPPTPSHTEHCLWTWTSLTFLTPWGRVPLNLYPAEKSSAVASLCPCCSLFSGRSWDTVGVSEMRRDWLSCVAFRWGLFFPKHPDWCHSDAEPSLHMALALANPWDTALLPRSTGPRQAAASLGIPWDFCWVASDPLLTPSLTIYQSGGLHLCLPGHSLRSCLMQPMYLQRLSRCLSLTCSLQAKVDLRDP